MSLYSGRTYFFFPHSFLDALHKCRSLRSIWIDDISKHEKYLVIKIKYFKALNIIIVVQNIEIRAQFGQARKLAYSG